MGHPTWKTANYLCGGFWELMFIVLEYPLDFGTLHRNQNGEGACLSALLLFFFFGGGGEEGGGTVTCGVLFGGWRLKNVILIWYT